MKRHHILYLLFVFILGSCSSEEIIEIDQIVETIDVPNQLRGAFVSNAHPTSGSAVVNLNKTKLNFLNFKTDDGPELAVYLSTDIKATEFVNLGELKGISGNFEYDIPEGTDLSKYKLVNIWCVDFFVPFGHAELK